jgi:hypothetical protein
MHFPTMAIHGIPSPAAPRDTDSLLVKAFTQADYAVTSPMWKCSGHAKKSQARQNDKHDRTRVDA